MRWTYLLVLLVVGSCGADVPPCDDCLILYDVTVIDGLGNAPVEHQVIIIRDDRIEQVLPVFEFNGELGDQQPDVSGMYVIPGLIDMHAHVTILPMQEDGSLANSMDQEASEHVLSTLLDFGITTVRNPAAPTEDGVALREAVEIGSLRGPEIFTAGSTFNRGGSNTGPSTRTPTERIAREEVRRQADIGVDYIKIYSSLSPDLISATIDEAHRHGLEVIGHLQRTTWTEATRLGIDHITHGAPWSVEYLPAEIHEGYAGSMKDRLVWLENVDIGGNTLQEMMTVMADSGVTVDPTLIAYRTKFYGDDVRYLNSPDSVYAPLLVRDIWRRGTFTSDWSAADYARGHAGWPVVLDLTKALYDGGVLLTAGSDLPNPWVIPGASLHEELELLVSAGIPPLEVLKIATHNAAISLRQADRLGAVVAGMEADLLVLASNPVEDIRQTRSIQLVVANGKVVSEVGASSIGQ